MGGGPIKGSYDQFTLYLVANIFCVILLILILLTSKKNFKNQISRKVFFASIVALIIMFVFDSIYAAIDLGRIPNASIGNAYAIKTLYFVLGLTAGYLWYLYFETSLKSKLIKSKLAIICSLSLVFVGIILLIINLKTDFLFSIKNESNGNFTKLKYNRTSLWSFGILYLCIYIYVFTSSIRCFVYSRKKEHYIDSKKFVFFGFVALIPSIFGFLQLIFNTLPIVCPGLTISTIIIYVYATNDQISNDNLTDLLNRKRILINIERTIKIKNDESLLVVFMMDLNKFKEINDKYGHLEGDKALIYTSEVLTKIANKQKKMLVGRFGGDEFLLTASLDNESEILNIIEQIKNELLAQKEKYNTEYELTASIGYAIYNKELNNIKDLIEEADKKLYEEKEKLEKNSR